MEMKVEYFACWLKEQIAECEKAQKMLFEDDRADEAVFEKIKANVYDIFSTILSVGMKTGKGDLNVVKCFFLEKMEQIPANWRESYEKAKEQDDAEKMQIETIKLETMENIKEKFIQSLEETA